MTRSLLGQSAHTHVHFRLRGEASSKPALIDMGQGMDPAATDPV